VLKGVLPKRPESEERGKKGGDKICFQKELKNGIILKCSMTTNSLERANTSLQFGISVGGGISQSKGSSDTKMRDEEVCGGGGKGGDFIILNTIGRGRTIRKNLYRKGGELWEGATAPASPSSRKKKKELEF